MLLIMFNIILTIRINLPIGNLWLSVVIGDMDIVILELLNEKDPRQAHVS
jgi:hypothetical protein